MGQSLDALERLLLHHGGGVPPTNHHDPTKRHTIRALIAITIGQIVGFFVAVWCIFRSVDSMFAPRYHPNDDSFVFLVSTDPQFSTKPTVNENKNGIDKALSSSRKSTFRDSFGSRNSKTRREKVDHHIWAPRSYQCKIVDMRSKQTGTAIARLGSHRNRDSTNEIRRRLIEFTIETRSKDLGLGSQSTPSKEGGEDPALVMANDFQQIGLGNASGNGSNNELAESILAGKVIRRHADCETFRAQVLGGDIPLDDKLRTDCRNIFSTDMETASLSEATNPETNSDTSLPSVQVSGRRRYLGFSTSAGSDLDITAEETFCRQLESVLNLILAAAADRKQAPHGILSDFLGISSSVNKLKSKPSKLSVKTTSESDFSGSGEDMSPMPLDPSSHRQSSSKQKKSHNHHSSSSLNSRHGKVVDRSSLESTSSHTESERSSNGGLASAVSVDSLKNMESRASLMPQGVNIPLPPKTEWPDYPVLVRCSEDVDMKIGVEGVSAYGALPINAQPIPFETNLFKGVAMIRVADLSTSPLDYFKGRRRKMQVCVQGKFKKPLRYDQVFGGQEFSGGLRNIPGKWLIKWAFELLKPRLPKSFEADLFGPTPYFLSPLVLTAQKMRADEGEPQPVTDFEIEEEMGPILGEKFYGKNDDKGRKKAFSGAGALSTTCFDTNLVYTFDYFQQFLRSDQFALDLGVKLLDLSHYLGEQPLLLTMAKDMESGDYLWKFELWHERCVPLDKSR